MLQIGSKRRRTKAEKAADDLAEKNKQQKVDDQLAEIFRLQQELEDTKRVAQENLTSAKVLSNLEH